MRIQAIPLVVRALLSIALIAAGIALLYFVWVDDGGEDETTAAGCPNGWSRFDDSVRHYRVCLPDNLVYYEDGATTPLDALDQSEAGFQERAMLVNQQWIDQWPSDFPDDPLAAPLSLHLRLIDASFAIEGCDPRDAATGAEPRSCEERLSLNLLGTTIPAEDGFIHLYKAALATDYVPEGESGDWDLYLLVDSPSAVWDAQGPVIDQIIASIETY